ncbi:MAG: hypothetical protein H7A09_08885 [Oceanospirillaceae bacterium]|nr:hypothetical protein [Oceanospirillaceae bacterium]MCP5335295.1 hypothetical protein [Oceanospirillaceae bacterium]MCP5350752.1 hypothetical protein [Oceanospirillaceae bacterium]
MRILPLLALCLFATNVTYAGGFIGAGYSMNNTNDYDHEQSTTRIDFGAKVHPNLDLEWNLVDLGVSAFNDPTFVPADTTDSDEDNDTPNFTNTRFGTVSRSEGSYTGLSQVHPRGVGVGLKWHTDIDTWLDFFIRGSMLAWGAETKSLEIYGPREALDANGDPTTEDNAANLNPCGNLAYCRIEEEGKKLWAVNYWFGTGFLIRPMEHLVIRTEFSGTRLKARDYPYSQYEILTTSLEFHF